MGYTTDFRGQFNLDKHLTREHREYLAAFSRTRRMKRDEAKANALPDPVRLAAGLPVGPEGAYFVGGEAYRGQMCDNSVIDGNTPPGQPKFGSGVPWDGLQALIKAGDCQPGLWCQWVPNDDGTAIWWDGSEKFYCYVEWTKYLITHFLKPWGYVLNGEVTWQGEDNNDMGAIVVDDNVVKVARASVVYGEPKEV